MMVNKEKFAQLRGQINKLTALIEGISEREIYPVAFFSQAYDITNTIQEQLRQIELAQIELFERQMKEHQAQILAIVPAEIKKMKEVGDPESSSGGEIGKMEEVVKIWEIVGARITNPREQAPREQQRHPELDSGSLTPPISPTSPTSPPELDSGSPNSSISPVSPVSPISSISPRIDLKKVMTLNDRFLFCRELFANDEKRMSQTIADLNKEASFETSMAYLQNHFDWNLEEGHAADFVACLKKSFS